MTVIFCNPCGEKRVKDVYDKLQALLTSSPTNTCFICDKEVDHVTTDDYLNIVAKSISQDDLVTVSLNQPVIKTEALDDPNVPHVSAFGSAQDPEKRFNKQEIKTEVLHDSNVPSVSESESAYAGKKSKLPGRRSTRAKGHRDSEYSVKEEVSEVDQTSNSGESSDGTYVGDTSDDNDDDVESGDNVDESRKVIKRVTKVQGETSDAVSQLKIDAVQPKFTQILEIIDDASKPYRCKKCSRQSCNLMSILRHICVIHLSIPIRELKLYQCNKCCEKTFNTFREWSRHTKQFICRDPSCGVVRKSKPSLKKHEAEHKGLKVEKKHQCQICGDEHKSWYQLNLHRKKAHPGVPYVVKKAKSDDGDSDKWSATAIENRKIKISSLNPELRKRFMDESYQGMGFKCKLCNRETQQMKIFVTHVSEHIDDKSLLDKPYQCQACCDATFETFTKWAQHVKPFKCEVPGCKVGVESRFVLKRHFRDEHTDWKITCPHCPKTFKRKCRLNDHVKALHEQSKEYVCPICGKQYATKLVLRAHEKRHSYTCERPFKCECGKAFKSVTQLKTHKMDHTGEKPFQCDQCEYRTKTKANLQLHLLRHSGHRPFVCEICGKKSLGLSWHKQHMQIHTGIGLLKCRYCDQRFKYTDTRARHERTHPECDGPKFICNVCGMDFISKLFLKRHSRVHTGEKPFRCALCEFRTNRADSLRTHQKQHKADHKMTKTLKTKTHNDTQRQDLDVNVIHCERRNLALQDDVNVIHNTERQNLALQGQLAAITETQMAAAYIVL